MRIALLLFVTAVAGVAQGPVIHHVGNAADYLGVSAGSLGALFGENLSDGVYYARQLPLPHTLGDTQLLVCSLVEPKICTATELLFVSAEQINFRVPSSIGGPCGGQVFRVMVGDRASTADPFLADYASICWNQPALFRMPGEPLRAIVTDAAGRVVWNSLPIEEGLVHVAWLTGLGYPEQDGDLRPESRIRVMLYTGRFAKTAIAEAEVFYAGPSPEFPGLYQVNFRISGLACGERELWIEIEQDGIRSDRASAPYRDSCQ